MFDSPVNTGPNGKPETDLKRNLEPSTVSLPSTPTNTIRIPDGFFRGYPAHPFLSRVFLEP